MTEIVAAFIGIFMAINIATDNAYTGYKEACEGKGMTYEASEELLAKTDLQYWICH